MPIARILQSGDSQILCLPKEFRLNTDRVKIFRRADEIVLQELPTSAVAIFDALASLSINRMPDKHEDSSTQEREGF